ncbi:MAG: hypothetical protein M0Q26_00780 [Chitinophagaceae bacterium]|nr:hypothetical protein [Chitinophagaceae bacterium]
MTAIETFDQLHSDFDKTLIALLNVRSINEIQTERKMPGYVYNQDKGIHEYWIALGQYSVSSNLSFLGFVINAGVQLLPTTLNSKQDIADYCSAFTKNKDKVIVTFESVIGKPNILFIGYTNPITMEEYLQNIVSDIHDEALNLEYNYKKIKV